MHSTFQFLELHALLPKSYPSPWKILLGVSSASIHFSASFLWEAPLEVTHVYTWSFGMHCAVPYYCVLTCWGNHPCCQEQGGTRCNNSVRMGHWPVHCFSASGEGRDLGGHRYLTFLGEQLRVETASLWVCLLYYDTASWNCWPRDLQIFTC